MSTEQPVQSGLEPNAPLSVSLTWNDEVFETILPLRRKTRIIRTRCDHLMTYAFFRTFQRVGSPASQGDES